MIGGVAAILPDTLDFRITRYLERYDAEIDPGPEPDARRIATQLAEAMERAYATGEPQDVMLHNIRLSADLWRQYTVHFDSDRDEVAVGIGPLVNGGWVPVQGSDRTPVSSPPPTRADGAHSSPPPRHEDSRNAARIKVGAPLARVHEAKTTIDVFGGPSYKFERRGDELEVHFLDWHRRWSHSLTLAAVCGTGTASIAALAEWLIPGGRTDSPLWAGLVVGLGFASHVLMDQLGHLGCNLLYPLSKRRTGGLRLLHSGDVIPNILTVWTATAMIILSLDRFSTQPHLSPLWLVGIAIWLPVVLLGGRYRWQRSRAVPGPKPVSQQPVSDTNPDEM